MSSLPNSFSSLTNAIEQARLQHNLTKQQVLVHVAHNLEEWRDGQRIIHFETAQKNLGPGRLVSYDLEGETVAVQLLGDPQILEISFQAINDFGPAKYYDNPESMGETLIGAFWEARITRRYLERIVANAYARLSIEEIDSFNEVAKVSDNEVSELFPLQLSEADVKRCICEIIGYPFPQQDWGGEACDLFCSIRFRAKSVPAAFVLKGRAYADRPLRISNLGKNGDQVARLFSLQARVFVIQSNGPVDGTIYSHVQAQVAEKLMTNQPVYYLIMDGIQTARLLRAYGKI